jgi:hypothetical protein
MDSPVGGIRKDCFHHRAHGDHRENIVSLQSLRPYGPEYLLIAARPAPNVGAGLARDQSKS